MINPIRWVAALRGKERPDAQAPIPGSLVAAGEVRASVHNDGLALLHLSTGKVYLCNETGSLIWQGIVAGLSPDAICEEISREFGVAADLVRRQTSPFLCELERRGLLVRRMECRT
jgi:hypothetical protein